LVDYQLALRDLHREKGSLLNYSQIGLSETEWPTPAYHDAYLRGQYFAPVANPELVTRPAPASAGGFDPSEPRPQILPEGLGTGGPVTPPMGTQPGTGPAGAPGAAPGATPNAVPEPIDPQVRNSGSLNASPFQLP
jgi:hypothetical protein